MLDFTVEQLKIINTKKHHVEVIACPGSGKTEVLKARILKLIDTGVAPERILVLSFSNQAVSTVRAKLNQDFVAQMTFHAYGSSLLNKNYQRLGYSKKPKLLTPNRQVTVMAQALTTKPKSLKTINKAFRDAAQDIKVNSNELMDLYLRVHGDNESVTKLAKIYEEFAPYLQCETAIKNIFIKYEKLKKQKGLIDYSDMVKCAKRIVNEVGAQDYQYLFVDECQDMSKAQAQLLIALSKVIPNVMTFGDPNQAIYGFMGGQYWQLSKLMPEVVQYPLTQSFRLTQGTADFATVLINPEVGAGSFKGRSPGMSPILYKCKSAQERSNKLLGVIVKVIQRNKNRRPTIAVLARTKAQLRDFEAVLLNNSYKVDSKFRTQQLEYVEKVIALLNMLKKLDNQKPSKKLGKQKLERRILKVTKLGSKSFKPRTLAQCRRLINHIQFTPSLEGRYILARKILEKLLRSVGELSKDIRAELGRWEPIARKFDNASVLKRYIHKLQAQPSIVTSTIHGAKGGEWDYVLVLGVIDGCLPHYTAINLKNNNQKRLEAEERRIFNVAVTRPRKRLYLFEEPFHHARTKKTYIEPSRFLTQSALTKLELR